MTLRKLILTTAVVVAVFPAHAAYSQQSSAGTATGTPTENPDLRIRFTGYLLGYYRVPDVQAEDFLGSCWEGATATDRWANSSPAVQDLKSKGAIPYTRDPDTVIIGMGDNFAIDLGSRVYGTPGHMHPKQRDPGFVDTAAVKGKPGDQWPAMSKPDEIGDNVGCFLSLAGYDIIVPGKLDLYFGAERLRRIAQRLESVKDDGTFHPVQMLALNVIERTTSWKEAPKIIDSEKKLKFTPGLPEGMQAVEITDHGTVLPFLQTVTFRVHANDNPAPYLCRGAPDDDIDRKLPCASGQVGLQLVMCDPAKQLTVCQDKDGKQDIRTYSLGKLEAEANYGLCVPPRADLGETGPHCIRFTVARPYLLGALSPTCPGTTGACQEWEKPYYFKRLSDGRQVVVFGIVDPDFPLLVGRDNLSWKNTDSRLETEMASIDPVRALEQAMQYFEANEKDVDKSKLRKVLLVQMSRAKAEELASHLDFDVVIASAANRGRAMGNATLTYAPDVVESGGRAYRPIVVVPERALDTTRSLINPVRELTMRDFDASDAGGQRREMTVRTSSERVSNGAPPQTFKQQLDNVAKDWLPLEPAGNDDPFVVATLKIMRDATNADLAMMQKRDFYFGKLRPSINMGENIAGVLWKGDILQVITVTGDTLKKVLKESRQFDQADIQPTKDSEESGRGLLVYGIKSTEDGNYLIDGSLLNRGRLYTIATTNHISVGDTGYPELNDPALADKTLPHPQRQAASANEQNLENEKHGEGREISELACAALKQTGCVSDVGDALFASSDQKAPHTTVDLLPRMVAWSLTSMERPVMSKEEKPGPTIEDAVQNRATWRISLKELSWNFSAVRNNLSEVQRVTQLTGASDSAAYAAKGHNIDYATRAEWERNTSSVDEFIRGQLLYKENSTGSTKTINPSSTVVPSLPNFSQPKNQALVDTGFFWHGLGRNKYYPQQGIVFEPFHFDTPLFKNELFINSHYNNSTGVLDRLAFKVPLDRTRLYLGRLGYRFENRANSFEIGYEAGWETNALEKLTFLAGGNPKECDLTAKQTLTTCLTGQPITIQPDTIREIRDTRSRNGFYVNLDWTLPLFWRMSFVAFDQGEYFREDHLDNSSDTLYHNTASGTVRIYIWSNFSIAPGLERLDYENKMNHTHLATWSPVLKLVYNFDKYSGGNWAKSTRFKPPAGN